jgi:hypothetical protein
MTYQKPTIVDYGDLRDMTSAVTIIGSEDGASKLTTDNHHSIP